MLASEPIIATLMAHEEPAIRYKTLLALGRGDTAAAQTARAAIPDGPAARALLSGRDADGRITTHRHPYFKWQGAHWVLATLADIGYPPGDERLRPMMGQVFDWLLGDSHRRSIRVIDGRTRRCASQESNALFAALTLGLADERAEQLAADLARWQWPGGGWNCDKRPAVQIASFHESWIPVRSLALHARLTGNATSRAAVASAVEIFLSRELFRRRSDGKVMDAAFTRLSYPSYWHYDILAGLKTMREAGYLDDPRCAAALDLLAGKRLPDGGFLAEMRYYRLGQSAASGRSSFDWGGTSKRRMNPWVTVDALKVLQAAGRMN